MARLLDINIRAGAAAAWTTANPTLHAGEPGFETDTGKLKIGDGSTVWTALGYAAIRPSLFTAKGDQLGVTGSGVVTRHAIGPDNSVQMADSSQADGWKWGTLVAFLGGDGSDGAVTISSNTTLTRDMQYTNLTVNAGVTLKTGGWKIYWTGTFTNNGTVDNSGGNAAANVAGAGGAQGSISGGRGGGAGGTGNGANGFQTGLNAWGTANPGVGGSGASGASGGFSAGTAAYPSTLTSIPLIAAITGYSFAIGTGGVGLLSGNGSGCGGGGDSTNPGGGGGGGGGVVLCCGNILAGNGAFTSNGGNGGNAAAGNCGGGGGGPGGTILITCRDKSGWTGTTSVAGGTGGTKTGTGTAGTGGPVGHATVTAVSA